MRSTSFDAANNLLKSYLKSKSFKLTLSTTSLILDEFPLAKLSITVTSWPRFTSLFTK